MKHAPFIYSLLPLLNTRTHLLSTLCNSAFTSKTDMFANEIVLQIYCRVHDKTKACCPSKNGKQKISPPLQLFTVAIEVYL